jgi:hypothetical protein
VAHVAGAPQNSAILWRMGLVRHRIVFEFFYLSRTPPNNTPPWIAFSVLKSLKENDKKFKK